MMTPLNPNKNRVLGLMSGTSLDGLDLAVAVFWQEGPVWKYSLEACQTRPYPFGWKKKLAEARNLSVADLEKCSVEYARWLAQEVKLFLCSFGGDAPELIASHGHTVHHRPHEGITVQIGDGATLFAETGIPVVCNFRQADVDLDGQGAPLVPLGDVLLFSQYQACLNLGGFSNISFGYGGQRIAFDLCAVNTVLNPLAERLGKPFDKDGLLAKSGSLNSALLRDLNQLEFYRLLPPKSLGVEWVDAEVWPVLNAHCIPERDKLRTYTHHIAEVLSSSFEHHGLREILVTGGGAYNVFLLSLMREMSAAKITVPDNSLVEFKEALVFAFLGLLRKIGHINVLASVTGAKKDHSSGDIFC